LIRREPPVRAAEDAAGETVAPAVNDPAADSESMPDPDPACLFCLTPYDQSVINDPDAVCPHCASPLCPAGKWHLEYKGQRTINRIPTHLDITFYTTWPQPAACSGQTLDISPNGMRFKSERRLGEGRRVKINSDIIDAIALVTHCQCDGDTGHWIVGVTFETLRLARSQGIFFSTKA